mmetsp:Transcript_48445/g.113453  ORF Transcript_48445/g.113453 Transcript_48445/m.113453 type:complete len:212 (-) Transcript_48445:385-1020(-)
MQRLKPSLHLELDDLRLVCHPQLPTWRLRLGIEAAGFRAGVLHVDEGVLDFHKPVPEDVALLLVLLVGVGAKLGFHVTFAKLRGVLSSCRCRTFLVDGLSSQSRRGRQSRPTRLLLGLLGVFLLHLERSPLHRRDPTAIVIRERGHIKDTIFNLLHHADRVALVQIIARQAVVFQHTAEALLDFLEERRFCLQQVAAHSVAEFIAQAIRHA